MAGPEVVVSVKTELNRIIAELQKIAKESAKVGDGLKTAGEDVGDALDKQTTRTRDFFTVLRGTSAKVAQEIKKDFLALAGINAMSGALKLSNQFSKTISETIALSDAIRKFGTIFGIAGNEFANFEAKLTKGLGDIGLSSEAATESLKGLSQTQVRGQQNLIDYSVASGQLASVTGDKGQEGEISKSLASTITTKGGDPNDMSQMHEMAEETLKIFNSTGMKASESLHAMNTLFTGMSEDFRKKFGAHTFGSIIRAEQIAGPNSTAFIQDLMGKSSIARKGLESRGFEGVINEKGIDVAKFKAAAARLFAEFKGDPKLMAKTLGMGDDSAEGFLRLNDALGRVNASQEQSWESQAKLGRQLQETKTLAEAFASSLNKVKSSLAVPLAAATQGLTSGLSKASETSGGSAAVVAGAGIFAALLAGGALSAIGNVVGSAFGGKLGGKLGGKAAGFGEAAAFESATGRTVQPVYVVNASEMSGGDWRSGAGGAGDATGWFGKAAGAAEGAGAGAAGTAAGVGALPVLLAAAVAAGLAYVGYKVTADNDEKRAVRTGNNDYSGGMGAMDASEGHFSNMQALKPQAAPFVGPPKLEIKMNVESKTVDIKKTEVREISGPQ